jgi:hypothetical protein
MIEVQPDFSGDKMKFTNIKLVDTP